MFTNKQTLLVALILSLPAAIIGMETKNKTIDKTIKTCGTHKYRNKQYTKGAVDYAEAYNCIAKAESYKKLMDKDLKEKAKLISQFAQKNADNPGTYYSDDIKTLSLWLNQQRDAVRQDDAWSFLIQQLAFNVSTCRCICAQYVISKQIKNLVKEIAEDLTPGQNCTEQLVSRAETIVQNALERKYE